MAKDPFVLPLKKPYRAQLTRRLPFRGIILSKGSDVWVEAKVVYSQRLRIRVVGLNLVGWVDPCDLSA